MHAFVARGQVAAYGRNSGELLAFRGDQFDFRADGVAVALVPDQLQGEPMILRGRFVSENVGGTVVRGYDGVDAAIVVNIADSHAAGHPGLEKTSTGDPGN